MWHWCTKGGTLTRPRGPSPPLTGTSDAPEAPIRRVRGGGGGGSHPTKSRGGSGGGQPTTE
eukprot:514781-Alexandrium_andersonii.AAC.1